MKKSSANECKSVSSLVLDDVGVSTGLNRALLTLNSKRPPPKVAISIFPLGLSAIPLMSELVSEFEVSPVPSNFVTSAPSNL